MNKILLYGKSYPMRLTMGALREFKRETGKDINEVSGADIEGLMQFMYCCVRSACRGDGIEFDLDLDRFCDGIDLVQFIEFQGTIETPGATGTAKKKKA